ncbi:MAG: hypothetical protein VB012_00125 [Erysipelotrichaceae bacterium]|nr:hypothetical protein [Erysipelotrichaceae bacterium]
MLIGYNQICINPIKPTIHVGIFAPKTSLINVRGDLYARCLRLKNAKQNLIIIAFDSLGITSDIQAQIEEKIKAELNEEVSFIFSSTHTHYAPSLCNMHGLINVDRPYLEYTIRKVALMVKNCRLQEKNITVSYNWESFSNVGQTRISNKANDNIYAGALSFFDSHSRIGNIVFYNCHPTTPQNNANYFTSEYPGSALETLTKKNPSEFFIFLQGADGDVSTRLTRKNNNYEEITRLGNEMAGVFLRLMSKNQLSVKKPLTLDYDFGRLEIHNQLKEVPMLNDKQKSEMTEKEIKELMTGITFVTSMKDQLKPHLSTIQISFLKIGPYRLIFSPFELFSDYNDYIDKDRTLLVCYSQGLVGYLTQPGNKHLSYEYLIELQTEEDKQNIIRLIRQLNNEPL